MKDGAQLENQPREEEVSDTIIRHMARVALFAFIF
jgi:hypothetical protein